MRLGKSVLDMVRKNGAKALALNRIMHRAEKKS